MNDLGPLKTIFKSKNVENMRNGRLRIRNLVTNSNLPISANSAAATRETALDTTPLDTRDVKHQEISRERDFQKEYQYVPPAAKRFYLWDSTQTGVSCFSETQSDISQAQINFIALSNVLTVLERHGFKEPGFLLGTKDTKVVFDRFDMGKNNAPTLVLKGDEIMKIYFKETKSSDNYRDLVLEFEKYLTNISAVIYYPWIVNIQLKEEELEIFSARLVPKVSLKYFGIPTIRIVPSALIMDLLQETDVRYGFMAIDQARHVVFLKNELKNTDFCLIGMWVTGIEDMKEEIIKQLSVYYLMNRVLSKLGSSFLICLYSQDPRFYQVSYETKQDDFWLQKAELNVSVSNSDQDIIMEFENIDIGREEAFCQVYKEIRGADLAQPLVFEQELPIEKMDDSQKSEEIVANNDQAEFDLEDSQKKDINTSHSLKVEDQQDVLLTEKEVTKEQGVPCNLEQTPQIRITAQPEDSQNQQWVYLTLLQQQIDILRTQMMHLLNKENNLSKVSVSTNTPSLSIQDYGTNTSFKVEIPEKKDQSVQVLLLEPVEVSEKETFLDIPDLHQEDLNIDSESKPPFDTGTNYKPFFSVSKVEENPQETKDSPETTFSKSMIAQLAQNPNSSFIYESQNVCPDKEISQELPDGSSMNTTQFSAGHSFATQEYLKRHGLLNESIISTVPTTAQNSGIFLKPPRSSSEFKVLDSMRLKSLGKLL